jgi:pyroglutamyl-peptidase
MSRKSVLLTAFEPFGAWSTNSSQLCLEQLAPQLAPEWDVTTRIYPVEFATVRERLAADLQADYDFCLHLGQAQQAGRIRLESIAVNVGGVPGQPAEEFSPLAADGPVAFGSNLPLAAWAVKLRDRGIPAHVSYHAGTYLCNATLYWSHLHVQRHGLRTRPCFIHVPLDLSQVLAHPSDWPTLPAATSAQAVRLVLDELSNLAG